jgi:hypothetical protein
MLLVGLAGCESSSSVTATSPAEETSENSDESINKTEVADVAVEAADSEESSVQAEEAEQKYQLASQLLEFAGPIDDLSAESKNVRWLAADLLHTAIELDPSEFKYYRDLFMTYMVLQEPVRAINAIEPATHAPILADEVAEFQSLVFGALEFASLINPES